ncbi:DUF547 domain-containing protein [Vibrio sinaloensis]|uniref:DUF547 domain-containing protein n=1 Tax=Photobacterium sp. (strain ATCC 43367) TaxID=379097 RepID=UPI00205E872F|nr:DUF547 domain-containing protein [Vibrio sinaloensis]UPQ88358.1 DUF547 domain-containing protein [Vibrio sinaloensis]
MVRIVTLLLTLISFYTFAAPKSELWPFWQKADQSNQATISHQPWQNFLDNYLETSGDNTLVRYSDVSKQDKQQLDQYILALAKIDPRLYSLDEQYAYWVNLYNAITVQLIIEAYPIKSITKLGGLFSFGPWDDEVIQVSGKQLSLNDIEHRILRPIWNDPRTHYAVNCASLGCPNLQSQAFTAENTEQLLETAAKEFINSDKGVLVKANSLRLSSIYDWFIADFGNQQQLVDHINHYRSEPITSVKDANYEYDWDLNKQ